MEQLIAKSVQIEEDSKNIIKQQHELSVGIAIAMGYTNGNHSTVKVRATGDQEDIMYNYTEGSVTKKADGRWTAKLYIDGKQKTVATDKLKYVVVEKLNNAIKQKYQPKQPALINSYTLFGWLDYWYTKYKKDHIKTNDNIERIMRLHIKPYIEDMPLTEVKTIHLDNILLNNSSTRMALYARTVISSAFTKAFTLELIDKNPATTMTSIKHTAVPGRAIQSIDMDKIFQLVTEPRYATALKLYALTGCRAEELFSIYGRDVDLDNETIQIHGTKTITSDRIIPMFAGAKKILEAMPLVPDKPILLFSHNALAIYLKRTNKNNNVSIKIKDFRTTFATMCAEKGVPSHVLAKWMGHTNSKTTKQYYIKVRPDYEKLEAQKIDIEW